MTRVVKLALLLYWTQVGRPKYFININIKKCRKNICNVIEAYVTIFWQTLFVCKIIVLSHDVCSADSHAAWLAAACIYIYEPHTLKQFEKRKGSFPPCFEFGENVCLFAVSIHTWKFNQIFANLCWHNKEKKMLFRKCDWWEIIDNVLFDFEFSWSLH